MTEQRMPHAVMDLPTRRLKALKIERLLGLSLAGSRIRLLEVGCGSGGISHYFGTHPSGRYEVHAVDVVDSRVVFDGYTFTKVKATALPFADEGFDVVISNHVIEHVGDDEAQLHHLQELRRVMKPGGIGYLAVPNRWMLVEPHYQLAFLSWLPVGWRSPYLRMFRNARFYDCKPLEMAELESKLTASEFKFQNICVEGIRAMLTIEGKKGLLQRGVSLMPDRVLAWFNPVNPTLVYCISVK
jgi:SAM-dependent methyltransferase